MASGPEGNNASDMKHVASADSFPTDFHSNDSNWQTIVATARNMSVPPDTVLMKSGEQCPGFMLITNGSVRVFQYAEDGREMTLYRLAPGDVCVMSLHALITNRPFEAIACTETELQALVLSPAQFATALEQCTVFRDHILLHMSNRYCDMLSLVQASAFQHLDMRLACLLATRAGGNGTAIHTTHQELARELGTTREVISRILKEMERAGTIRLARGRIDIVDGERLRDFRQD